MVIETIVIPRFSTNCYIISDGEGALCIDPGGRAGDIYEALAKKGLSLEKIVLTHGHFDHITGVEELREKSGAPVLIHRLDAEYLTNPQKPFARAGREAPFRGADILLSEGDTISIGRAAFSVLHTPGHTQGSVCLFGEGVLFSGDTLFKETIGRHDFADQADMKASVKRLLALPPDTRVYPGHFEATTIGHEREHNPYNRFDIEWE